MLYISPDIMIPEKEIQWEAVRSGGPGGQNVNKVSSAVHLRFDLNASGLPETVKTRISAMRDRRITKEGVIVIKAQRFRNREKNRQDAVERLRTIIQGALQPPKKRRPTRPSGAAKQNRMDSKSKRGSLKRLRARVRPEDF